MTEGLTSQTQNDVLLRGVWRYDQRQPNPTDSRSFFTPSSDIPAYPVEFQPDPVAFPQLETPDRTSPSLNVGHASPLAPLRKRDAEALDAFFEIDRIQDITLDIHRYLARMYPEPCWEDEPYEFLHGYI